MTKKPWWKSPFIGYLALAVFYPEFGQRQQTPPAVPGNVTYRG